MYDFIYLTGSTLPALETLVESYYNDGYTPVGSVINISGSYIQSMQSSVFDATAYDIN